MTEDPAIDRLRDLAQTVTARYESRRAAIGARNAAMRAASAAGTRNRDLIQKTGLKKQQVIRILREAHVTEDAPGDVPALAQQVSEATAAYDEAKTKRDEAIRTAEAAGMKPAALIEATGLSRDRVRTIRKTQG